MADDFDAYVDAELAELEALCEEWELVNEPEFEWK